MNKIASLPKLAKKRSVKINGARTTVSLEDQFWIALKEIAAEHGWTVIDFIEEINRNCGAGNLSSALRVHFLKYYQRASRNKEPAC